MIESDAIAQQHADVLPNLDQASLVEQPSTEKLIVAIVNIRVGQQITPHGYMFKILPPPEVEVEVEVETVAEDVAEDVAEVKAEVKAEVSERCCRLCHSAALAGQ